MSYTACDYSDSPKLLRDFLFYMQTIKGRSALTVDNYFLDLRTFLKFIKYHKKLVPKDTPFDEIDISDLTPSLLEDISLSDVYEFFNYIDKERKNGPKARARKACSIRMFYKYLTHTMNVIENNPVEYLELPSLPKTLPKHMSLEQSIDLLSAFDEQSPFYYRDFCIITLFLNCGMRLSELTGLNLNSVSANTLQVVGKGNKERMLYLNNACIKALDDHLRERSKMRNIVDREALFLNHHGKRLGQRGIQLMVSSLLEKAGLGDLGLSTHKLRHTAATLMYQYGEVDIRILQEILGHSNLNTTQIYTHVASKQRESAIESNPLSKFKK